MDNEKANEVLITCKLFGSRVVHAYTWRDKTCMDILPGFREVRERANGFHISGGCLWVEGEEVMTGYWDEAVDSHLWEFRHPSLPHAVGVRLTLELFLEAFSSW
jgi:hypothetical protein